MSDTPAERHPGSLCTFPVDDVVAADSPIWTEPLGSFVTKRFGRKLLFVAESEKPVINSHYVPPSLRPSIPEFGMRTKGTIVEPVSRCHPLIDAVGTAFSQHRPLTISPDSIWMVIEQGFAHHVAEKAEALRHRLVRHDGSLELTAMIHDLSQSSFEAAIGSFSSQIREHSDPFLHENLLCDFSTTTSTIRTASEVVLMDCYFSYFTYGMMCVCGIPKVTVTGSLMDWRRIRERVEMLETFDLDWWIVRLRPILDEFVRTLEGHPNLEFWRAIYKPKQAYAQEIVTGWIADLFPYLNDAPERQRNHILEHKREGWAVPVEKGIEMRFNPDASEGVSRKRFPSGLASVPVDLKFPDGSSNPFDLVAGFLAVEQRQSDLALSPVIGWSLAERPPAVPVGIFR